MPTIICGVFAAPRYHFAVCFILWIFYQYNIAFLWYLVFFWLYWDEMRTEYLDFDEFMDDCFDSFGPEYGFGNIREVYERYELIHAYNPTFDLGINPNEAGELAKKQGTEDVFKAINYHEEWDSAELSYLEYLIDYVREEWDYMIDIDAEGFSEGNFDGLNEHYEFSLETEKLDFSDELTIDYQPRFNQVLSSDIQGISSIDQSLSVATSCSFKKKLTLSPYYPYWEENLRFTPPVHLDPYLQKLEDAKDKKNRRGKKKGARNVKKGDLLAKANKKKP